MFNSSVNFYIYLVKLRILHNTFTNCCHEEIENLSRERRRETLRQQHIETHEMGSIKSRPRSVTGKNIRTERLSPECPDVVRSSVYN